ncbi:hypothetical protein FZC35_00585 [Candidatus Cytomitobacter indipagum]|uniref:Uncharacterized protein n=2 Tax=Candidatus Cytomitobacter indipagum TaxID=2601575 RepID=A0A5C0UF40_9PROT|nr:hypothetical protein FZC35_00585 [Candidatus Cytomitobacter indipagum]
MYVVLINLAYITDLIYSTHINNLVTYMKIVKKIKNILCVCLIILEISYTILLSIAKSYFSFVKIIINHSQIETMLKFNAIHLSNASQSALAIWITLTPGTIAFIENNEIIVHSACGNTSDEINIMIDQLNNWVSKIHKLTN